MAIYREYQYCCVVSKFDDGVGVMRSPVTIPLVVAENENVSSINLPGKIRGGKCMMVLESWVNRDYWKGLSTHP
jgi:hypothetical protein